MSGFLPNKRLMNIIENYRRKNQIEKKNMNILDWGCGKGRTVLWLREQGYNAFGIDIDPLTIENGIDLFVTKNYDASTLNLLLNNNRTNFQENFFHLIFSEQVFEHVSSLDTVAEEQWRITRHGGVGFHIFPAHKYIVEGHLFMPFVHWLPKNSLRRYIIYIYTVLGVEPHWKELDSYSIREKADKYYNYSINKTFYRKYKIVRQVFERPGFNVKFTTVDNPKISKNKIIGRFIQLKFFINILNILILNFLSIELFLTKR